jgi:hypothetical protein
MLSGCSDEENATFAPAWQNSRGARRATAWATANTQSGDPQLSARADQRFRSPRPARAPDG